jgi:predicted dehydrogenase
MNRRSFIKKSLAYGGISFLPSHVLFGQQSTTGLAAPNELLNVAAIGIGNQGGSNISGLLGTKLCRMAALCDVDLKGKHTQGAQQRSPDAKTYTDFRVMFDEMADEIDAVLIATPDHSHFSAAMLAMSLGKPVYVQKPLAHTFGQCERLIDLAARSGVVTQMGNQGHSGANYFQFKAWSEAGVIKDVTRITAFMNRGRRWHGWGQDCKGYPSEPLPEGMNWDQWIDAAREHPFSSKLHPGNWRSWFDYGSGAFGDWGPHILDTCHRFLKLGLPETIEAVQRDGANPFVFPQASTIRFGFPEREGMPACDVTWYDGVRNKPKIERELGDLEVDEATGKETRKPVSLRAPGKIIYGKDLVFKGDSHGSPLQIVPREKYMAMRRELPRFAQRNSGHFENFLLAVKGEEESRSPFSVSGPLTQVFNLGVLAQRFGETLTFDRKTKTITNHTGAQALLDPTPRKGWEEFYRL